MEQTMRKKIRNYLIAGVVVFAVVFFGGVRFVGLTWSESLLLSAFLTVVGVGGFWWREQVGS
jgi:hypothetical protein